MYDSNKAIGNKPELSFLNIVKQLVLKKDYNGIQTLFLEHIALPNYIDYLSEFWICISYLIKPTIGLSNQAKELAELIFEHLFEDSYFPEALEHIRKFGNLLNPDRSLRQKITILYKNVYSDNPNLDILIRMSEINESANLSQAIDSLDKMLNLNIGNPVYSTRFGYGEIIKIDFVLDTLTIFFFNNQTQTITLQQAIKSIQPIAINNIFYLKEKKSPVITQLIKENPAELEKIIKRDLPEHHKTTDIKQLLTGVVADQDIQSFVDYINKKNPKPKKLTKKITPPLDTTLLNKMTIDEITSLLNSSASNTQQKILQEIKLNRTGWQDLFFNIFFNQNDKRVLQTIFSELDETRQKQIIDKIFTEYKRNPDHFLWLADYARFDSYSVLYRYLDLAIQYPAEIRKRLVANDYTFIRNSLDTISAKNAKRTLARINDIKNFYPEEKDKIESVFKQRFPELFEVKEEYIYHTESAIRNKEQELKKIISEEIPQVANEIGHARSYGDLSENFEYKAALEKQKRLMHRTSVIREELAQARPIDFGKTETDKVGLGTTIKLSPITSGTPAVIYTLLGPWDSNPHQGIISYLAPFAQKLLDKKVGDEITDDEGKKYKIIEITKAY
jgi:transcription elongation GreA/GreB family factor